MKILIATAGTRGDVQPYVALARGLVTAGHEVTIATNKLFESFIRKNGIDFYPTSENPQKAMQEDVSKIGGNPVKFMSWLNRNLKPIVRQAFIELKDACSYLVRRFRW
jgi:sterol 3beta-glucosyltransferase